MIDRYSGGPKLDRFRLARTLAITVVLSGIVLVSIAVLEARAAAVKRLPHLSRMSAGAPQQAASAPAPNWEQVPFMAHGVNTPTQPGQRYSAGSTYDEAHRVVVIFGGGSLPSPCDASQSISILNDTWTWDGTQWIEQHPVNKPPARNFTQMAYHGGVAKAILFGGVSESGVYLNDTWGWDGTGWTSLNPATSPPPRVGAALAYDPQRQKLVLYGGFSRDAGGTAHYYGDTWIFDGTNWSEVTSLAQPGPRLDAGITYVPANGGLILFGGSGSDGPLNDTWLWNGDNWTQLLPSNSPPAASQRNLAYHGGTSVAVLYLYGVSSFNRGETWIWDGQDWKKSATASSPFSRWGSVYVYHPGIDRLLMYGGVGNLCGTRDDEYLWDGTAWKQVDLGEEFPPSRSYVSGQMAFDTARNQSVLFGGYGTCGSDLSDTWLWDGVSWREARPATNPPGRSDASMAYDPERRLTVLFGGRGGELGVTPFNDTWVFDGNDWTLKAPSISPPARDGAMMAFDAPSRKVVLFGGRVRNADQSTTVSNETWTWDGNIWEQQNPLVSPPARVAGSMAHDAGGTPVLFGGIDTGKALIFADTWRWNSTIGTWEPVSAAGPSPRDEASMGYDARSQSIILFGGSSIGIKWLGDTWAFDGMIWTQLSPGTSPNAHAFAAMSDGSITNPPVLMGGGRAAGTFESCQAWTWGVPTPQVRPVSVVTRKTHGSAGTFDVDLPFTGSAGIECRSGGTNNAHQIVCKFTNVVNFSGASVTRGSSGAAEVDGPPQRSADGKEITVNLKNVSDVQRITIRLLGVSDGTNTNDVSVEMGVLLGDTNGDGAVNSGDIAQTKSQSGQFVTSSNFREDVTADGFLNSGDIALVKSKSGTGLPSAP